MIKFRVLGPIEAVRDGVPVALGGRRQRVLLGLLLLERGRAVPIDRLADELWHGEPPDGAATTVRAYVSKLRTALGSDTPITSSAAGYALDITPDQLDSSRFERLIREGHDAMVRGAPRRAAEQLRAGLELWQGQPFAGIDHEGSLRVEAERLAEVRLSAREEHIDAHLALGQATELIEELEALLREHPYRERLWRQLMLALYRAERQTDALAAYRRARNLLDSELGLEPSEELQRLEQSILRHEVPPAQPPEQRHNLPAPVSSFIGRDTELADIERLLGTTRLLTLSGVGGVGKTRLALEAAARAVAGSPDGVFFVDLSALSEPALVARQVAMTLGVREHPDIPATEQLSARLREADLVLVLDNCEHLREASAELCQHLLGSCPRLRVLATGRETLGVPGELDYPVPPLPVPSPGAELDELRQSEAVRLFVARTSEVQPRASDDAAALLTTARICRDLDGLPLAIELAAARAKAFSIEEIATRLADRFQFLVSWRRLTPARHRTLRAAMDWSYELLSDAEQELLDRLSVFAGGFTLAAAADVCLGRDDRAAVDLVGRLVEASLVVAEDHQGQTRYRLLETVRQYALERLEARGETADTRRRHADHFLVLAGSAEVHGAGQRQGLGQLDADADNLRAAADFVVASADVDAELRLVAALWPYWQIRGHLSEGRARLEAAIARDQATESSAYNRAAFGAGILAWSVGDYPRARSLANDLLATTEATGSTADEHAAHKILSHVALRERDFASSEQHAKRTLSLARALASDHDTITAQLNLAVLYLDWGKTEAAIPMLEDVLDYNRRNGIAEGTGFALLNLGEAAYHLGEYERARKQFDEARVAFASIGFKAHVGHALTGLAGVEASSGNYEEAAAFLGRADSFLAEVGASKDDFDPTLADKVEAEARERLGDERFIAAFENGRRAETHP